MEAALLKRRYLCEVRMGSLNPEGLVVPPGHDVVLCEYCFLYHAVPWHVDEAEVLRMARGLARLEEILGVSRRVD